MTENPLFVGSVAKAIKVLEAFDPDTYSLSLTEVMSRTEMSKSAAQRYVFTLQQLGYLSKDPRSKRFSTTIKALFPAGNFINQNILISNVQPHILQLRHELDARVGLATRFNDRMVYLLSLRSISTVGENEFPGFSVPLYCTSSGRLYLSFEDDDALQQTLETQVIEQRTPYTKTSIPLIKEEIRQVRQNGFCITEEEYKLGHINISVPILGHKHRPIAAFVAVFDARQYDRDYLVQQALSVMQTVAAKISIPSV